VFSTAESAPTSQAAVESIAAATRFKMLLAGADVTMLCSVLLRHGIEDIEVLERELKQWLERNRHESIGEIKGLVSHKNCSNPSAFERANYARALDTYDSLFLMAGKPHFS
jgi:hypothetical protein